ncbi:MAG: hypothetical protein AB1568_11215 [Thermodesulfobacteriota bacterium]
MADLTLDIHGLLRLVVADPPGWLRSFLLRKLGHFVRGGTEAGQSADILLLPLAPARLRFPREILLHSPYHMAVTRYEESPGIALGCGGETELLYVPGHPIRLYYRNDARLQGRLYLLFLFALHQGLAARGALLVHGAAAVRGDRCIALCGLRGSGKSQLFLELLENGWDYLGDDKCIVAAGEAMLFQPNIGITDFHLRGRPELRSCMGRPDRILFAPPVRWARELLYRTPLPWLRRWYGFFPERLLRPAVQLHAQCVFPGVRLVDRQRIRTLFLLETGVALTVRRRKLTEVLGQLTAIQSLLFAPMSPFERMLAFCSDSSVSPDREVLATHLRGIEAIHSVTIPYGTPARAIYEAIAPCCEPA